VAEQGCLLSSYPGKTGIGGSNPPLSAMIESHVNLRRTDFVVRLFAGESSINLQFALPGTAVASSCSYQHLAL
jgi:hypothetical protein